MARLRTVLSFGIVWGLLSACVSSPPPAPPEPEPFDVALLREGELAAMAPLGVVLVKRRTEGPAGVVMWELANEMKVLTVPEAALVALGIRGLASAPEIAWARAFLASDIEAPGPAGYDPKRAMGWMELMRSGRFDALVRGFGELCAVSQDRELQAVEKSLLDAARVWLVAEISAVEASPPDTVDAWLSSGCKALAL